MTKLDEITSSIRSFKRTFGMTPTKIRIGAKQMELIRGEIFNLSILTISDSSNKKQIHGLEIIDSDNPDEFRVY